MGILKTRFRKTLKVASSCKWKGGIPPFTWFNLTSRWFCTFCLKIPGINKNQHIWRPRNGKSKYRLLWSVEPQFLEEFSTILVLSRTFYLQLVWTLAYILAALGPLPKCCTCFFLILDPRLPGRGENRKCLKTPPRIHQKLNSTFPTDP